jgi:periplasmic protein TonB
MLFKTGHKGEGGGFLLLSLFLHALLIAGFCVWGVTHAVSAAPGPQIIEVALVVDNSLPSLSKTAQAAAQKAPQPVQEKPRHETKKRRPVTLAAFKATPKSAPEDLEEHPDETVSASDSFAPPAPVSSTAQAAAGSQNANDYAAELLAWLNRHKRYPPEARAQNMEGQAVLWLTLQPDGTISGFRIESTGSPLLDEAVRGMVKRADPVPPPPENLPVRTFRVPVIFKIKS